MLKFRVDRRITPLSICIKFLLNFTGLTVSIVPQSHGRASIRFLLQGSESQRLALNNTSRLTISSASFSIGTLVIERIQLKLISLVSY